MTGKLDPGGPVLLVGAGKMGGAMLEGWLALGLDPKQVEIAEPRPGPEIEALCARTGMALNVQGPPPAVVLLAVKPQIAPDVMADIRMRLEPGALVVSVMAGRTLAWMAERLGPDVAIVRSIPNTPAAIGRGITVAVANPTVTGAQKALAETMLAATGEAVFVDDEALIDPVTAVSGSGPAYVFLLAESLAKAGVAAGLPADLATRLARATVSGAGELLHRSDLPAAQLRENVTSPKGTTAEALAVLMAADGLDPLMEKAVAAATRRSRELAA